MGTDVPSRGQTCASASLTRSGGYEMEKFWQDLRYAIRTQAKNPGFTVIAILTLALGIGANTAIFSLLDAVLLRNLPVSNPRELTLTDPDDHGAHFGSQGEERSLEYLHNNCASFSKMPAVDSNLPQGAVNGNSDWFSPSQQSAANNYIWLQVMGRNCARQRRVL
jgi:hypothetical protein